MDYEAVHTHPKPPFPIIIMNIQDKTHTYVNVENIEGTPSWPFTPYSGFTSGNYIPPPQRSVL